MLAHQVHLPSFLAGLSVEIVAVGVAADRGIVVHRNDEVKVEEKRYGLTDNTNETPPRTPILRQIESATVGDYDLWAGSYDEVNSAHNRKVQLYQRFGDFSLLKIVSLSSCGLDDNDANALAHILTLRQTGILQMDLSYNKLTGIAHNEYVGFERMFAAIADRHCRLRALNLRGNRIHCEGARAVAIALKQNCNLTELDISEGYLSRNMDSHKVDYSGIIAIAKSMTFNSHMWHLTMDTTFCDDEAGKELGYALASTKTLKTFSGVPIKETLSNLIRKIRIPSRTGVCGTYMGVYLIDKCSAFTYPLPARLDTMKICSIHISDSLIDALCQSLRNNHGLQRLDIKFEDEETNEKVKLNGQQMKKLALSMAENKGITAIDISNHEIGDEGGKALAGLIDKKMGNSCSHELVYKPCLVSVSAKGNSIKNVGAEKLAQSLHNNRVLTHLDISNNPIGDNEAFRKFFDALRFRSSLISLNISNCFRLTQCEVKTCLSSNESDRNTSEEEDESSLESSSDDEEVPTKSRQKQWEKVYDDESRQFYFANRESGESRWDKPTVDEGYWSSDDDSSAADESKEEKPFYHIKVRRLLLGDESNDEEDEDGDASCDGNSQLEDWENDARDTNGSNIKTLSNEEKESAALAIAELIFDNGETGNLTSLDISCNNIGDQNMHFIFEALKSNGTLTSLSCGGNNMWVNGSLSLLAETLSSRNAIEHLSLKGETRR